MHVALSAVREQLAFVYLEDIFVPSRSAVENMDHVKDVPTILRHAGTTVTLKKY